TRLRVSGLAHVPQDGPAILAANHTGWLGLDYALVAICVHDGLGRLPRGMVHKAWFRAPQTAAFASKVGLVEVSKDAMARELAAGHLVIVFPEGEKGAFRPASGYQVTEFARGFVRVAQALDVPIVPVAVLGGEESNPVERTVRTYEELLDMPVPVPQNLFPRPVKWRIGFLAPVRVPPGADVHAVASDVQAGVQAELDRLRRERGHPYI
ncbi:MAG TPA: lysophospholipid acyltransferase family protein, partial [Candidatus Thermoplasmatota archaeon]|nr:lysophospholipid acyltransferase family protein [Candidatus Thermoplasmatota archaeon]